MRLRDHPEFSSADEGAEVLSCCITFISREQPHVVVIAGFDDC